jgi:hypothetical protein
MLTFTTNTYNNVEYTIIVPSCRPHFVSDIKSSLQGFNINHFDGTGYPSSAKLTNDVIINCPTEIVFINQDKCRGSAEQIYICLDYINAGYGMAWLWPFGFGCFKKDVIRRVGFFEERCAGGQWDDSDMIRRLKEADIGAVMLHSTQRIQLNTLWRPHESEVFFKKKWIGPGEMIRNLGEMDYHYNIGAYQGSQFRPWKDSIVDAHPPSSDEQNSKYRKALGL